MGFFHGLINLVSTVPVREGVAAIESPHPVPVNSMASQSFGRIFDHDTQVKKIMY